MEMLSDSFQRLLLKTGQDQAALWNEVSGAGFLDLLSPEESGGAGLSMSDAFPIAFLLGSSGVDLPVVETMIARALLVFGPRREDTASWSWRMVGSYPAGRRSPFGARRTDWISPKDDRLGHKS